MRLLPTAASGCGAFASAIKISLALVGKEADRVASAVGWRQGDTIHGLRGRDDHRCGMASQRHLSRLGTK
jgi:hypothetical protein